MNPGFLNSSLNIILTGFQPYWKRKTYLWTPITEIVGAIFILICEWGWCFCQKGVDFQHATQLFHVHILGFKIVVTCDFGQNKVSGSQKMN